MRRILFLLTNLAGGGAEKVLVDILRHTDFERYEVDLLLVVKEGIYLDSLPEQVNIYSLYKRRGLKYKLDFFFSRYWGIDFFQSRLIKKRIEKRYDAIVSFMEGIPLKFHKYIVNQGQVNISWVHTDMERLHYTAKYFRKHEEQQLYSQMNKVIVVSQQAQKGFSKVFKIHSSVYTLYNPIDRNSIITLADAINVTKTRLTICCVGRLTYAKRYDRAIRIIHKLIKCGYDVELWIAGNGVMERQLRKLAEDLNVEKHVTFLGFQSNPYPYVKAADIFLSTSMTEGYPLVICEALCLEKPIVATNVTGPREILGNSEYGLLTEENDDAIFAGVRRMIDDEALRAHYVAKARERKQEFEIQPVVDRIYNIICSSSHD